MSALLAKKINGQWVIRWGCGCLKNQHGIHESNCIDKKFFRLHK